MKSDMRGRLIELIIKKAFIYSKEPIFKLVSGKMSNYYFNCKAVTLDPEGMYLIGNIVFDLIKDLDIKGIGGLTLGADPISIAVAYTSFLKNKPISAFVVRKSPKEHGTMQWIEGNINSGDNIVVVDDVVTTGKSTIQAIERARESGLNVKKVVVLIDRQEGGREAIESIGYGLTSVFTRDEIMSLYKKSLFL